MNKFLTWLIGGSLIGLCACGDDSSSNAGGNDDAGGVVASTLCLSTPLDGSDAECGSFVLNESDSTFSFLRWIDYGFCGGTDSLNMSWHLEKIKAQVSSKYSIRGDSLYVRSNEIYTMNEIPLGYLSTKDDNAVVTTFWSPKHDGIKGTWRYVSQYLDSPRGYVNSPFENHAVFWTFSENRLLQDTVENPGYNFFRTSFVEDLLFSIYYKEGGAPNAIHAGYFSKFYPYNLSSLDIQMDSRSETEATFTVGGEKVVISNVDFELIFFSRFKVFLDVEYAGKKCPYRYHVENISEQTCRQENVDFMYLEDGWNSYTLDTTVRVWSSEIRFEDNRREFEECLGFSE